MHNCIRNLVSPKSQTQLKRLSSGSSSKDTYKVFFVYLSTLFGLTSSK